MPIPTPTPTAKLRLYGIVFIAVIALLLSLSVAIFQKAFTSVVRVTLQADTIGTQLEPPADVKLRGLIVGEVRAMRADGDKATLDIALTPEYVSRIPSNVHAMLLPKTLFGEKYVDLVAPKQPSSRPIRAGDVITQDRTKAAIELQKLNSDLLPLLRAVQPAKLNATLTAFATALEGRGDRMGDNLARLERYLRRFNPHMPSFKANLSRFADVVEVYGDAAPDMVRVLRNSITNSRTMIEKRQALESVLTGTTRSADTAEDVFGDNADRLITLAHVSRPNLALFARYSPVYPCLLRGLVKSEPRAEGIFEGGKMHITLEATLPRSAYQPGEEPRYADRSGPNCRGLPDPPVPDPGHRLKDGTKGTGSTAAPGGHSRQVSGTASEQRLVGALVAPAMNIPADEVPSVATLLFGPMARGTAVSFA
ncbi:MCE family protein [Streptomyces sp. 8N706]|uniref:MCE family protein n=1 Tax=Streptomyces sp. 8N706 TaxID=3457416 RepID=UPI003FCFA918